MTGISKSTDATVAHIRGDGAMQSLEDHLRGTSRVCREFTSSVGMPDAGELMGLLHDLGKATSAFQRYILSEESEFQRGSIDHSTAGAQILQTYRRFDSKEDKFLSLGIEMMQIAIASHHSGLINCISSDGLDTFSSRIWKDDNVSRLTEARSIVDPSILSDAEILIPKAAGSIAHHLDSIRKGVESKKALWFQYGLLTRMLLSCLIDADRIDTISFQENSVYVSPHVDWILLRDRFEEGISHSSNDSPISKIRCDVSDECLKASGRAHGIFTLSVPTGGGKTLSSFRFAINHVVRNNMNRIIYVVPYLSIIEQNAHVIERILNSEPEDDYVTECHSNADVREIHSSNPTGDDDEETSGWWTSPMDSWDGPVIFTSMVQFLEVLFGSGTKKIRRMHNLAGAVIVFDEIQSLPLKTVCMFNEAINFLCHECGSTAVLCTATQPLLGEVKSHPLRLGPDAEIIRDVKSLYTSLKRTEVRCINPQGPPWSANDVANLAVSALGKVSSVLVVVNTKRMAADTFRFARSEVGDDALVVHLSTSMCPAHRRIVLNEVFASLGHRKVLCVSTQLIEAGVDVDFDVVIRSMAGLDSIAQAAGRCNRNAVRDIGDVLVVRTGEGTGSLVDIYEGGRCAESVMRRGYPDLLSPDAMRDYYEQFFFKRSADMDYPIGRGGRTLFDLLSVNEFGSMNCGGSRDAPRCGIMPQAFSDANHEFRVIDGNDSIIVPYDDTARKSISVLCGEGSYGERMHAMRILQQYTVNTFALDHLIRAGAVSELPGHGRSCYCLAEGFYDEYTGVREIAEQDPLIF